MLIEILYNTSVYIRCLVNFDKKEIKILEGPNKDIKFVNSCFEYSDGFHCEFNNMYAFLRNRGINKDSKTGVYRNVDSKTFVVVIRNDEI